MLRLSKQNCSKVKEKQKNRKTATKSYWKGHKISKKISHLYWCYWANVETGGICFKVFWPLKMSCFRTWNFKIILALVHIRAFKLLWSMLRGFKQHSEFSGHQHMCAKVCAYNRVWFAYESSDSWAVGNKKLHKLTSNLHM